jgi:hypothetical protein
MAVLVYTRVHGSGMISMTNWRRLSDVHGPAYIFISKPVQARFYHDRVLVLPLSLPYRFIIYATVLLACITCIIAGSIPGLKA